MVFWDFQQCKLDFKIIGSNNCIAEELAVNSYGFETIIKKVKYDISIETNRFRPKI